MLQDSHPHKLRLLTVDVGNTVVHLGMFEDDKLEVVRRIATGKTIAEEGIVDLAKEVRAIAISSVVPSLTPFFEKLATELGVRSLLITHNLDLGVELRVEKPSKVGADRICNAVAAHLKYGSPAVVIDFGTAITFDVIERGGVYIGGLILPGAAIDVETLAQKTALLPLVELQKPKSVIGRDTEEAIRSGVFYSIIGGVELIYEKILEVLGDAKLIFTGGGVEFFLEDLDIEGVHDPHLTLEGLRLIYERNEY